MTIPRSALHEDARRIYGPTTARRWAYADTKAIDEFLALARFDESLQCAIACLFNTVGPRQVASTGWSSRVSWRRPSPASH